MKLVYEFAVVVTADSVILVGMMMMLRTQGCGGEGQTKVANPRYL